MSKLLKRVSGDRRKPGISPQPTKGRGSREWNEHLAKIRRVMFEFTEKASTYINSVGSNKNDQSMMVGDIIKAVLDPISAEFGKDLTSFELGGIIADAIRSEAQETLAKYRERGTQL